MSRDVSQFLTVSQYFMQSQNDSWWLTMDQNVLWCLTIFINIYWYLKVAHGCLLVSQDV